MNYFKQNITLIWLFVLLFLTVGTEALSAQDGEEQTAQEEESTVPDTALVGLYVVNMYDFDIGDGAYSTEFWFWSVHKNKEITFESSPEVVETKKAEFSNYFMEEKEGLYWINKKCRARVIQDWDVRKFPFDKQVLKIKVEETQMDISDIVYVADVKNTKVDSQLVLEEWAIDSISVAAVPSVYNTTYGDPTLSGTSTYAALETSFYMTRLSSWILLIKMTTGLYVAFLISLLVFTILPPDSESRIGLAVGGLFAAVGNKYIVESIVPTSTQTTLVDNLHNVTFLFILIIVAAVIYATNIFVKGKEERSKQVDRIAFGLILISFIVINFLLIRSAAA